MTRISWRINRKKAWEESPLWLRMTLGKGLGLLPPRMVVGQELQEECRMGA